MTQPTTPTETRTPLEEALLALHAAEIALSSDGAMARQVALRQVQASILKLAGEVEP